MRSLGRRKWNVSVREYVQPVTLGVSKGGRAVFFVMLRRLYWGRILRCENRSLGVRHRWPRGERKMRGVLRMSGGVRWGGMRGWASTAHQLGSDGVCALGRSAGPCARAAETACRARVESDSWQGRARRGCPCGRWSDERRHSTCGHFYRRTGRAVLPPLWVTMGGEPG